MADWVKDWREIQEGLERQKKQEEEKKKKKKRKFNALETYLGVAAVDKHTQELNDTLNY